MRSGAAIAAIGVAVAGLAWHMTYLTVPLVDDAGTSIAYALTLMRGGGLRLTPASQQVEAFSNPLWVFLSAAGIGLHLPPIAFTQWLGKMLGMLALVAAAAWGPAVNGRRLELTDAAVGLAALVTSYAYWCASGMETGLQALLLALSGALLLRELRTGRGALCGVTLGLLCLTRPEGVLYVVAGGGVWLAARLSRGQRPGMQEAKIVAGVVVLLGGYLAFRRIYFASWLPNTYFAKIEWDFGAGAYLLGFCESHAPLVALVAVAAGLGLLHPRTRLQTALALSFLAADLVFIWKAHGDWMREWRFLAPVVPMAGVLCAAGASAALAWVGGAAGRVGAWLGVGAALLAVAGAQVHTAGTRSRALQQTPEFSVAWSVPAHAAAQRALEPFELRHPLVGLVDLGGAGLTWLTADVIDVASLGDYALARNPSLAARQDYLLSQMPVLLDAHGPSQYLLRLKGLMAQYEPAAQRFRQLSQWGGLWIVKGLSPTQDPRCPGGKAEVTSLTLPQLSERLETLMGSQPGEAQRLWLCAFQYRTDPELPLPAWRAEQSRTLAARAGALERQGQLRQALAYAELAATLSGGTAGYRAHAERLRARLFPPPR